jgi:alpha-tubulin suppressor-like RCC1 family protein
VGYDGSYQFGDNGTQTKTTPINLTTEDSISSKVTQISAGGSQSLFVTEDGKYWYMGGNGFYQLGTGYQTSQKFPATKTAYSGVKSIAAATKHSMLVDGTGNAYGMGMNLGGEIGTGDFAAYKYTPASTKAVANVVAVAARYDHTLFVESDGSLWATGRNTEGQLGDGLTTSLSTPIKALEGVGKAFTGVRSSWAIKTDGSLWVSGDTYNGRDGYNVIIYKSHLGFAAFTLP